MAECREEKFWSCGLQLLLFRQFLNQHLSLFFLLMSLSFDRKYGLDDNTVDFIGHALALHRDDRYLNEPALDTVKRMKVKMHIHHYLGYEFS